MRKGQLLREVAREARSQGMTWQMVRQGGRHEVWSVGSVNVAVPRHSQVSVGVADSVRKAVAAEFGKDWWRK